MIENHPADSRVRIDYSGSCQTLPARMGTGGGNVPLVLFVQEQKHEQEDPEAYAVDSHPMDSRISIAEDVFPSITAKLAKLSSDGPLVLVRKA